MLVLNTKEEIQKASQALIAAWETINKKGFLPLKLHLKGLGTFGKRLDACDVIYGQIVEDDQFEKLFPITDIIIKSMMEVNVLKKEQLAFTIYDPSSDTYKLEKFHMTILFSKFKAKSKKGRKRKDCLIDGTEVIKYYGEYEFGYFEFIRLELSNINDPKKDTEYYMCEQAVSNK